MTSQEIDAFTELFDQRGEVIVVMTGGKYLVCLLKVRSVDQGVPLAVEQLVGDGKVKLVTGGQSYWILSGEKSEQLARWMLQRPISRKLRVELSFFLEARRMLDRRGGGKPTISEKDIEERKLLVQSLTRARKYMKQGIDPFESTRELTPAQRGRVRKYL